MNIVFYKQVWRQIDVHRYSFLLECIRRYYVGDSSPLYDCLKRYDPFFKLFGCFRGYVDFFLMNDLLNENDTIKFFHPFEVFGKNVLPATVEEYHTYRENCLQFVDARNRRIEPYCNICKK